MCIYVYIVYERKKKTEANIVAARRRHSHHCNIDGPPVQKKKISNISTLVYLLDEATHYLPTFFKIYAIKQLTIYRLLRIYSARPLTTSDF
jgi:hypothetical protein